MDSFIELDVTPKWYPTQDFAAVGRAIPWLVEKYDLQEIRVTRQKLFVKAKIALDASRSELEALMAEIIEGLEPFKSEEKLSPYQPRNPLGGHY